MIRFRNFLPHVVALLVGTAILGMPTRADAALKIRITSAGADNDFATVGDNISFTWTDQSLLPPPPDANPLPGMVGTGPAFLVGSFLVNVDGVSKPFGTNDAFNANLHMHALTVTNVGGLSGKIRIELTDTDYSLTTAGPLATLTSTIGGTANGSPIPGSTVDLATQSIQFGSGAATEFAPAPDFVLTNAPPVLGPGAFSDTKTGNFAYAGQSFSITEKVELTLTTAAVVSLDYDSHVTTPAPPGWILAATAGLAALGYRVRRKTVVA